MDFRGMEYVEAVYRHRSFTKAAAELYISQPSLSAAVRKVEQRLGFPIFDRSTTPIRLTELGRAYLSGAEQIRTVEKELDQFVSDRLSGQAGRIAVGGTALFISYFLPPILSSFYAAFPGITVELEETDTAQLQRRLLAGRLDLVADNGEMDPAVIGAESLCQDHMILAVPRQLACNQTAEAYQIPLEEIRTGEYLRKGRPAVPMTLFRSAPFLLLKPGNDTRKRADRILRASGVRPEIRLELDQQITGYHLSCFGMGASFVSDTLLRLVKPEPSLVYYRPAEAGEARQIRLFYKRSRYRTRAMEEFLRMARGCMAGADAGAAKRPQPGREAESGAGPRT